MGALHRFYLPQARWDLGWGEMEGDEAHHCARVFRHQLGDRVEVFDGCGGHAIAEVVEINKEQVKLTWDEPRVDAPARPSICLAQAILKGKAMEWLIQKAVELGVAEVAPLLTSRVVARASEHGGKGSKWRRLALETCKQCGQNWLPEVREPISLPPWIQANKDRAGYVASLSDLAKPLGAWQTAQNQGKEEDPILVIGPEGDFTQDEIECFRQARFQEVSLGANVLRSETAAICGLTILFYEFSESRIGNMVCE